MKQYEKYVDGIVYKIYGPYVRKDKRSHVILIDMDNTRTTLSYPRYLLEKHLNRKLKTNETFDHVNNDKGDNSIDNLQILSLTDNIKKSSKIRQVYEFICPHCGSKSVKMLNYVKSNWRKGKSGPYCSRSCAGKAYSHASANLVARTNITACRLTG